MKKVRRLDVKGLKNIILSEQKKMKEFGDFKSTETAAKETEETGAGEYQKRLSNKIDYLKALKIHEARLVTKLREVRNKIGTTMEEL